MGNFSTLKKVVFKSLVIVTILSIVTIIVIYLCNDISIFIKKGISFSFYLIISLLPFVIINILPEVFRSLDKIKSFILTSFIFLKLSLLVLKFLHFFCSSKLLFSPTANLALFRQINQKLFIYSGYLTFSSSKTKFSSIKIFFVLK